MNSNEDVMLFSEVSHEDFGPTAAASQTGIRALSYPTGCIPRVLRGKLKDIVMQIPNAYEISAHLYFYTAHTELCLCDDYIFYNRKGRRATFKVRCRQPGYYTLKIYVRSRGTNGMWPNVFNYVIEILKPDETADAFPIPVECYDRGDFELQFPLSRVLPSCEKVLFNLTVATAKTVAVISDGKKTSLVSEGVDQAWTGEVITGKAGTELRVVAEFPGVVKLPAILLLYQVMDRENKMDEKESKQRSVDSENDNENAEAVVGNHKKGIEEEDLESYRLEFSNDNAAVMNTKMADDVEKEDSRLVYNTEVDYVRADLLLKMKSRNLKVLESAIADIHEQSLTEELEVEIVAAERVAKSLSHLEELQTIVFQQGTTAVSEVRRFTVPPRAVHDIMTALFLLLGYREEKARNWSYCQKLCSTLGHRGLCRKLEVFDIFRVDPEILDRAWQIIRHINVESIVQICPAAAAFYTWVAGVHEEHFDFYGSLPSQKPEPTNL